jgi:hypothetical protein
MIGVIAAVIAGAVFGLGPAAGAGPKSMCDAAPSFGFSCDERGGAPTSVPSPSVSTSPSPSVCPSPSPSASPTTTPAPAETVTPQPCASAS